MGQLGHHLVLQRPGELLDRKETPGLCARSLQDASAYALTVEPVHADGLFSALRRDLVAQPVVTIVLNAGLCVLVLTSAEVDTMRTRRSADVAAGAQSGML